MQVGVASTSSHRYAFSRLAARYALVRSRVHASHGKYSAREPMLPEAPITGYTGEETRKITRQKRTQCKGRSPFCHIQCIAHRGTSACCAPLTRPSSHLPSVPRLSQNSDQFHDLEISQQTAGPAPLGGDRYNYIQNKYRHNVQSTI